MKIRMYIIILSVLYGCENGSLTITEQHELQASDNRVVSRISGTNMAQASERFRKLHNKELRDLYRPPTIVSTVKSRRLRWAGNLDRMGEKGMHTEFWWGNLLDNDDVEMEG
jgi:hypothetical protein